MRGRGWYLSRRSAIRMPFVVWKGFPICGWSGCSVKTWIRGGALRSGLRGWGAMCAWGCSPRVRRSVPIPSGCLPSGWNGWNCILWTARYCIFPAWIWWMAPPFWISSPMFLWRTAFRRRRKGLRLSPMNGWMWKFPNLLAVPCLRKRGVRWKIRCPWIPVPSIRMIRNGFTAFCSLAGR